MAKIDTKEQENQTETSQNERFYELYFVVDQDNAEGENSSAVQEIQKIIEDNEGKIKKTTNLAKRDLAYPINNKVSAYAGSIYFEIDPSNVNEIESTLNTSELSLLRYMIFKTSPEVLNKQKKQVEKQVEDLTKEAEKAEKENSAKENQEQETKEVVQEEKQEDKEGEFSSGETTQPATPKTASKDTNTAVSNEKETNQEEKTEKTKQKKEKKEKDDTSIDDIDKKLDEIMGEL